MAGHPTAIHKLRLHDKNKHQQHNSCTSGLGDPGSSLGRVRPKTLKKPHVKGIYPSVKKQQMDFFFYGGEFLPNKPVL